MRYPTDFNRLRSIVIFLIATGLLVSGCSSSSKPKNSSHGTPAPLVKENNLDQPAAQQNASPATVGIQPAESAHFVRSLSPLTAHEIEFRQSEIGRLPDYGRRLEQRRLLVRDFVARSQSLEAIKEIGRIVEEVEQQEGLDKAQRVALAEANNLQINEYHAPAADAYELLIRKYPRGRFTAESLMQIGICQMNARKYDQAEKSWLRLVQEYDEAPEAPCGWRKLALAQLVQGKFDESLATLDTMSAKYPDSEYADYALMRRGYVHMVAGDLPKAREQYNDFMLNCPQSKYCLLASQQLAMLTDYTGAVQATK